MRSDLLGWASLTSTVVEERVEPSWMCTPLARTGGGVLNVSVSPKSICINRAFIFFLLARGTSSPLAGVGVLATTSSGGMVTTSVISEEVNERTGMVVIMFRLTGAAGCVCWLTGVGGTVGTGKPVAVVRVSSVGAIGCLMSSARATIKTTLAARRHPQNTPFLEGLC